MERNKYELQRGVLARKYTTILQGFEEAKDDRRIAWNCYQQIIAACEAMRDSGMDNNFICCAVNKSIREQESEIDEIITRFTGKVYKGVGWLDVRDGASMSEMLSLLTPNGESIYGTPAGKLENAVGVAYHPHTCGLLPIFHRGRDSWSRPVYDDGTGRLLVDVDPRAGRKPDICTKQGNAFDGEPCDPVDGDFIFIPRRDTW